ncbi:MAG TPA: glycosyltransferase 87 family protein [Gaiellaceae bacterium]|nr:glycosyltransferase 87 family protein [Gaiellaceae bacterium]
MRLALVGAAVFVVCCVLVPQGLLHDTYYSDVHVYGDYGRRMLDGQIPYRDFSDEYPPLAQLVFLAARSALAFKLVMTACGVGIVWLLATVFRSRLAVAVFAVSPLLVGSIYLNAYDLWPAFLLAAALALFLRGQRTAAFVVLGLATAAKVYPVAVLPIMLLAVARDERVRGLAAFVGALVVVHLPVAALGPGGLKESYWLQAKRGLELNSLGSSILLAAGHRSLANEPPGSLNVTGGTADAVATVSSLLVLAAIALAAWLYARGRLPFVVACATAVAGFVAFDKVFSAQYVEWLAPLAPLAGIVAAALTTAALLLTHAVFSHRSAIAEQRDVAWLLARNATCVALFAWLALRPMKSELTPKASASAIEDGPARSARPSARRA